MLDVIDPEVLRHRNEFRERFRGADPFPHLVIDRYFTPEFCGELMQQFPPFERGTNLNEHGLPGGKSTVEDIRSLGDAYARADDLFRSAEFTELISDLTGIPSLRYDPDYIGGGTHENLPGQDLDPHVDFNFHPKTALHRRLNLIVYLNPEWEETWGGALELHEDPWLPPEKNRIQRVLPLANRAILFETSERSWHGFEAIRPPPDRPNISRKSLAIYMYTEERPPAETAPSHSTVYVERPLPFVLHPGRAVTFKEFARIRRMFVRRVQHIERLEAREAQFTTKVRSLLGDLLTSGSPLEERDVALLERLFRREDSLLRTLYDREKEFSADLAELGARVGDRPRTGLAVAGPARIDGAVTGYFPGDQWAGPSLDFDVVATAPISSMTLHGHLAEALDAGQILECRLGEVVQSKRIDPGPFEWRVPVSISSGDRARIHVSASRSLCPARDTPGSGDKRDLSYHLLGVEFA